MYSTAGNPMQDRATDGQAISHSFERSFLAIDLERAIAQCDDYDLAPLFRRLFLDLDHQPVLEAGHGSGRWVGWLVRQGIKAVGIDWSHNLCERASKHIPEGGFIQGDMRDLPFGDASLGGIISLGAVEHDIEGPGQALREYARVLRPGGVAVITVPYLGPVRRVGRIIQRPAAWGKGLRPLRKMAGKPVGVRARRDILAAARRGWAADVLHNDDGNAEFYQYVLDEVSMRGEISAAGLSVQREFVAFHDEGLMHSLPFVGKWNGHDGRVELTALGRSLKKILPVGKSGHMLCYLVVRR